MQVVITHRGGWTPPSASTTCLSMHLSSTFSSHGGPWDLGPHLPGAVPRGRPRDPPPSLLASLLSAAHFCCCCACACVPHACLVRTQLPGIPTN